MKTFLLNLIRKDQPESMKRFCGSVGFFAAAMVICIWQQDYIRELLYTSAGLVGAGIVDSLINKINTK